MNYTRRRFLSAVGGIAAAGVAGCTDTFAGDSPDDGTTDVRTSFFVLNDFTRAVAGDGANVESIVPFGQHAHGWEPSSQVQRDVLRSDAFVYMGEGFQPWADDVVANVRRDAPDVAIVNAREGIRLHDHSEAGGHGHDEDGRESENGRGSEGDHDHGGDAEGGDPHFWLNPQLAAEAVRNVETGLAEADAGNADAYEENARSYEATLDELDRTFEESLADTGRDLVLVAGHNAFRYLGERYDFEIHALTGVSPDAEPSPRAISRAQEVVAEHGIEHVLTPALESDRAATQLVEETDATATLPITSIAGLTEAWRENDWGYVEVMENVNLSSLKTALDAR